MASTNTIATYRAALEGIRAALANNGYKVSEMDLSHAGGKSKPGVFTVEIVPFHSASIFAWQTGEEAFTFVAAWANGGYIVDYRNDNPGEIVLKVDALKSAFKTAH